MANFSGVNGALKYGGTAGTAIAEIGNWNLTVERSEIDVSSFGDQWKDTINGMASWSASFEGNWDVATAASKQVDLQTDMIAGNNVVLAFYVSGGSNCYYGTARMTNMTVGVPFDDKVSVSFEVTGNGPVTYVATP